MSCKGCEERRQKLKAMYDYSKQRLQLAINRLTTGSTDQPVSSTEQSVDRTEQQTDLPNQSTDSTE